MITRIIFETVKIGGRKTGKCFCGKRITRSKTFEQTINPFNKNKNGEAKTRSEIVGELLAERKSWQAEPVHCHIPTYFEWLKEQREIFNAEGEITLVADCGAPVVHKKFMEGK